MEPQSSTNVDTTTIIVLARWRMWLQHHRRSLSIAAGGILLIAAGLIVALFLLPSQPDPNSPVRARDSVSVVRQFIAATETLDEEQIMEYIAPQSRPGQVLAEMQMTLQQLHRLEYRDTRLELLDNDGQIAHVHVSTNIYYELAKEGIGQASLQFVVTLIRVEGRWYISEVH